MATIFDKGNLAVVGKNFAVLQSAGVELSGFVAWLVWAVIHIQFLAEPNLRFSVILQWILDLYQRQARRATDNPAV